MGHSTVNAAICLLASTASAFTSPFPLHRTFGVSQTNGFESATSYTQLDRADANLMLLSMSAAAMPEGEYEGGRPSSPEGMPQDQDLRPSFLPQKPNIDTSASHISSDEMHPLQSQSVSPERRRRMEREEEVNSRFLHGDELHELREYVKKVELELEVAKESGFGPRIVDTQKALEEAKDMDAEFVYASCSENALNAERMGLFEESEELNKEAMEARSLLPQFNLEGLWVGK